MKVLQRPNEGTTLWEEIGRYAGDRPEGAPEHYKSYCRLGGGFIKWADPKDFVEAQMPTKQVPGLAQFDNEAPYPCTSNPYYRWNGWAVCNFDKPTYEKILKDGNMVEVLTRKEDEWDVIFHCPPEDVEGWDEDTADLCGSATHDDGRYTFDGWCWDFYTYWDYACNMVNYSLPDGVGVKLVSEGRKTLVVIGLPIDDTLPVVCAEDASITYIHKDDINGYIAEEN